tara:strand:+ start:29751 stop:29981 length:231 start_codon:yes stop_codon:yes gene_type:complete
MTIRRTVKEIKVVLDLLPDDMPVEIQPITDAWLGTSNKMRIGDINFYNADDTDIALPSEKDAHAVLYIYEDDLSPR